MPPERAYQAVKELDLSRSRLTRVLFALRGLPRRRSTTLQSLTGVGFVVLAEDPPVEIVLGLIGRFLRMRGGLRNFEADNSVSFADPGFVKAAWNFQVQEAEGGSTVSTRPESGPQTIVPSLLSPLLVLHRPLQRSHPPGSPPSDKERH